MCLVPGVPGFVIGAVGAVGVVFAVAGLVYVVRYFLKKRNENNDNGERQHLVGDGGGDQHAHVIHNPIEEFNPPNRSRQMPIGSSHAKADVNVIRSAHS